MADTLAIRTVGVRLVGCSMLLPRRGEAAVLALPPNATAATECATVGRTIKVWGRIARRYTAVDMEPELLGLPVTVQKVDLTVEHEIVAICSREGHRQAIPILEVPLPASRPDGAEWIDAYRRWRR